MLLWMPSILLCQFDQMFKLCAALLNVYIWNYVQFLFWHIVPLPTGMCGRMSQRVWQNCWWQVHSMWHRLFFMPKFRRLSPVLLRLHQPPWPMPRNMPHRFHSTKSQQHHNLRRQIIIRNQTLIQPHIHLKLPLPTPLHHSWHHYHCSRPHL